MEPKIKEREGAKWPCKEKGEKTGSEILQVLLASSFLLKSKSHDLNSILESEVSKSGSTPNPTTLSLLDEEEQGKRDRSVVL